MFTIKKIIFNFLHVGKGYIAISPCFNKSLIKVWLLVTVELKPLG